MPDTQRKWQTRILAACFVAYSAAYVCRVNISIALPMIQQDLGVSNTDAGLIGTLFFWVYALGQLVNGYSGDRINCRVFIFAGLAASAVLNIAMGLSSTFVLLLFVWGANGFFQSMLWGPIVKTLSNWFPAKRMPAVAYKMSFSMIVGYLAAWGLSGILVKLLNWRWAFWVPGVIVLALSAVWLALVRNKPADADVALGAEQPRPGEVSADYCAETGALKSSIWKLLLGPGLFLVVLSGLAQGFVDKGIQLWAPKLMLDGGLPYNISLLTVLILPMLNFLGIAISSWVNKLLKNRTRLVLSVLLGAALLACMALALLSSGSSYVGLALIACVSMFINGANPLMTSVIPMDFKRQNKVSAVAGAIDFSMYLGAGISSMLTGFLLDRFGWSSVFVMWSAVLALGTASMLFSLRRKTCPAGALPSA